MTSRAGERREWAQKLMLHPPKKDGCDYCPIEDDETFHETFDE